MTREDFLLWLKARMKDVLENEGPSAAMLGLISDLLKERHNIEVTYHPKWIDHSEVQKVIDSLK